MIRVYQKHVSRLFLPRCRHLPTCSQYAYEALEKHGLLRGLFLTGRRLLICHPWAAPRVDLVPGSYKRPTECHITSTKQELQ